jgi:hypothetical protein
MITDGRKFLIGCDCSFQSFGVAKYDPQTNAFQLFTGTILQAIAWIGKNCKLSECVAVVEDSNLDSPLFRATGILRVELQKYKRGEIGEGAVMSTFSRLSTMAQHLGKSKASAELIISLFREKQVPIVAIAPSDRHRADKTPRNGKEYLGISMLSMPTKTTSFQFQQATGYSGNSSEHARDAAFLVYGKSMQWAEDMILRKLEKLAEENRGKKLQATTGEEICVKNGKFTILNTVKSKQ